ncbi:MAG: TPM domain-containing protein [Chlorobium sp.]|uniref:TPM domain-containing protein n=1 Tax=Chlorobium sp. TaxID=1095 RepID=UPI0025C584A5|nr:TPM domain-containing protein [Chlorobium sp.]MCF8215492.1 TPM domain-containing protein [Chlorobium sp.]MCF8270283.1 TPM domain-containing protein [Chlorobium sp.]MCF8286699.1 TPM domain-containing protein [Chlorobium sp.]MCF8290392.1 TPM domain-containing protein [Chlorobium sp.]MCF8384275.1 TPM domain-containing protein [Chlorobium sp.]
MHKRTTPILLFLSLLGLLLRVSSAYALDVPQLSGRINDLAGMISPEVEAALDTRLALIEKQESTQIVILTVPSLEGDPVEDFSIKVAEAWKIGQKGVDNGLLFLVSRDDRKVRIEVGYGLEGRMTDLLAGRIVDTDVVPLFRAGQFDAGFQKGVESIILAVQGEYKAAPAKEKRGTPSLGLLVLIILFIYFISQISRGGGPFIHGGGPGGGYYGGGSFGSGGGFGGGGGFSGGGGGFGGGGASGNW